MSGSSMDFETYNPPSSLVVPEHPLTRAKFPFIDVHNHQFGMPDMDLSKLASEMDALNMQVMVNLSGRGRGDADHLRRGVENVKKNFPNRFIIFTNISDQGIDEPGYSEKLAQQIEDDFKVGANGLKIYKGLGFNWKDSKGNRIPVDDPRLDAAWAKCGELGIPVLIHSADPKQFWEPFDANNERWLELKTHPGRKRSDTNPAPFDQIIREQHNVFRNHRNTTFINAHMGWMANDLAKLGKHLDENPNVNVEIGAIIAELGRQPRAAKEFFIKYQDRVLFGKDAYNPEEYYTYFRVLETADEYFPYYKKYHAFWPMYGLNLPDEVLKKLYYKNALRIVPNIDGSAFPD
ncbi:MAG: amidohydrolase family protein [Bacteroidetes bacterium]|nr:amidohydrolase family protein [Bacteroidota bacterium]